MTHYTILNTTTFQTIFNAYEVGTIQSFQLLKGGAENTNYKIQTSTGDYVLTICEQKPKQDALHLATLLVYLNENGFRTSKIITTKRGKTISEFNGKPILLKKFLEGIVISDFSNIQMEAVGKELATLHAIPNLSSLPTQHGYGIEQFTKVQKVTPTSSFCNWLLSTKQYIENYLQEDLPKCLNHSDLFYSNIVVNPKTGKVTIMDFEEAAYYYRIFDIGMTLVGTCASESQLHLEKAHHLLKGYQAQQPLTLTEQRALQAFTVYGATATAYWRYMNFNFVRPDEQQKNQYVEMQQLATFVKEIPTTVFQSIF